MFILCNTLLPSDRVNTFPADVGKTIKSILVADKVIEFDVAPIIQKLSTDCNIVFRVL